LKKETCETTNFLYPKKKTNAIKENFLIFTCALRFGSSTRIMLVQIVFQRVPATTHSHHYVITKNLIEFI